MTLSQVRPLLPKRNNNGVGLLQLAVFLASWQPAIDRLLALSRQPEQQADYQETVELFYYATGRHFNDSPLC